MIIRRLCDLEAREELLADPAFETMPVPYAIELDDGGILLGHGISSRRGNIVIPAKKKGGEPKTKPDAGKRVPIPRPHGNTASQGFARFFVNAVSRIVPMENDLAKKGEKDRAGELAKRGRSRATFWSQIDRAADETEDPALRAVQAFGRSLNSDPDLASKLEKALVARGAAPTDRCTFAYAPDRGKTILDRESVRAWYRQFYREYTGGRQEAGPTGICQITGKIGPIPTTHPIKLNVPGWMSMGVALVSYDKAAFESYGLEGTANAAIGYEAADAYGLALKRLTQGGKRSSLRVGETLFLFWTREPASLDFMDLFDAPTTASIAHLLKAPDAGQAEQSSTSVDDFYCLVLSSNSARVIVRDYLEERLPKVKQNVVTWFRDLTIASTNKDDLGHPVATFPLWQLASSMTAPKSGNQVDWSRINDLIPRLVAAALKGDELPDGILASCLQRLRAEGSHGFRPPRMALMKICLIRKGVSMSEKLNPLESNPAYICGELLAVFDQIQRAALGKLKANVVDKYYGGFSAAPLTALGNLFENAQHHLQSIRTKNVQRAASLDKRLALVARKLKDVPEGQLTFADQARFALGYYHAKADQIERWAKIQQERAEAESRKRADKSTASKSASEA